MFQVFVTYFYVRGLEFINRETMTMGSIQSKKRRRKSGVAPSHRGRL